MTRPSAQRSGFRRPVQKRSVARVEAILDEAEALLSEDGGADISIHTLAERAGMAAASIYHFFPQPGLVLNALAERYLRRFERNALRNPPVGVKSWQELQTMQYRAGKDWFNSHPAARKILLGGPATSADIRTQDLSSNIIVATRGIELMTQLFILPDIPHLIERLVEVIVINDAIWALSIHRHGLITDAMEEQARRARIAYSRTFLPEFLPLRAEAPPERRLRAAGVAGGD